MNVTLIGMGSGQPENLTLQGLAALRQADLILGARRLLAVLPAGCTENRAAAYRPDEVAELLQTSGAENAVLVYSGDTGRPPLCTRLEDRAMSESKKTVFVVGLGPGGGQFLTVQAQSALQQAEVLCGYTVYIDLVRPLYPEKECYTTGMTREIDRCRWALDTARAGRDVALVCSGDAGVYGMASPLLELAEEYPDVNVEVVPGLTAALSGGAVLGAPLAHDFCVISLSDRLTPWEVIEKRLVCAAQGDFALALYNPSSKGRPDYLRRAVDVLLANGKAPDTLCGYVRNIGREGQEKHILPLSQLRDTEVDMFTTVFVGSAATRALSGRMVTPRGYRR